jgi:regulator of replication initiation timing
MNEYTTKPQINIFEGISTSRTMANKGIPDFALPKKNDASVLAKDLLPLHNKKADRFQTDIQLNGKTRFEEKNTIIKSLEEEIINMKHKLSFVYEKDEEIGKLKGTVNDLKKEIKELQAYSSECMKLRLENKNLRDQLDLQSMNKNKNDKLESENMNLKDKIKELTKEDNTITDITDFISDDDDLSYESDEELMDVNVPQLRSVLFRRLQDKQKQHIDNLITSYELKKKNKVKKSVLEKMLEQAIHL